MASVMYKVQKQNGRVIENLQFSKKKYPNKTELGGIDATESRIL